MSDNSTSGGSSITVDTDELMTDKEMRERIRNGTNQIGISKSIVKKNDWRITIIDGQDSYETEFMHPGDLDPNAVEHTIPFPPKHWPDTFTGGGWPQLVGLECVVTVDGETISGTIVDFNDEGLVIT